MRLLAVIAALLLAFTAGAAEAPKYSDPDDPAVLAAARAALGSAKILDIERPTRDIENITRGIDSVLKDLGAKVTDREIRIELAADVLFDFDKHDLRPEAVPSLEKVAEVLRSRAGSPVMIEGHTDGSDDPEGRKKNRRVEITVRTG